VKVNAPQQRQQIGVDSHGNKANNNLELVCAACHVKCSGEVSFLEHCKGKQHKSKSNGKVFAGVLKKNGKVPNLSSWLQGELARAENSGEGKSPLEAVQRMTISRTSEALLKSVLSTPMEDISAQKQLWNVVRNREHYVSHAPTRAPPLPPGAPHLKEIRESLPAYFHSEEILAAMDESQVLIVEGETGCGKTTQVPQYILDDCARRGQPCSVVCTQPRRISAIGVAERVADERGERIGDTIGYQVRMRARSLHPRICFSVLLEYCYVDWNWTNSFKAQHMWSLMRSMSVQLRAIFCC
jgi:hypothetical protein